MKEIILFEMFENNKKVAEHDITHLTHKEIVELVKIQKEYYGRRCRVKRVFIEEV